MSKPSFILAPEAEGEKLLAPRGVSAKDGVLAVSDTGNNRVCLWKNFSYLQNKKADVILGQPDSEQTGRNSDQPVSASSLQYPAGIWTDGVRLIVADAWNHRVLIWQTLPQKNAAPADVVLGQKDCKSNQLNLTGLHAAPSAKSLYWPYGVTSDGVSLWVADTGNRRVLFYAEIPRENFAAADQVIGQEGFDCRDYDPQNAIWPYSVKVSSDGKLALADPQYHRALVWEDKERAFSQKADRILGQKDWQASGQNQFLPHPKSHTLNWCYDVCFYQDQILVADTGNSRVLRWKKLPSENNAAADSVFGQPNFETIGESSLNMKLATESEVYWPFALNRDLEQLLVADTGNHRILFYTL